MVDQPGICPTQVGSKVLLEHNAERFGEELPGNAGEHGDVGVNPDAVANRVIKLAAREINSRQGRVPGYTATEARWAQASESRPARVPRRAGATSSQPHRQDQTAPHPLLAARRHSQGRQAHQGARHRAKGASGHRLACLHVGARADPCRSPAESRPLPHPSWVQIREKLESAEVRASHPHMFVGPNPDVGKEHHKKERHMGHHHNITGGFKSDEFPSVTKS